MPPINPAKSVQAYTAATLTRAARRCKEVAELNPKWPQARVRRVVAHEMELSTVQLRYVLRQAQAMTLTSIHEPDAHALSLADMTHPD